jgi:hypothetical protein
MADINDIGTIRSEIWNLLQMQMETLRSAQELTDRQIIECYNRQMLVQELREKLEACTSENRPEFALTENSSGPGTPQKNLDSFLAAA